MKQIWIVEFQYEGIGEAAAFSGAFTTEQKANEWAQKAAEDQKKAYEDVDEECVIKVTINSDGNTERGTYVSGGKYPSDWWTTRKVPLD